MNTAVKRPSIDQSSRTALMMSSALGGRPTPFYKVENTYKLDPDKPFSACEVRNVIKRVFEAEFRHKHYDPAESNLLSKKVADMIKKGVKELGFSRYKLVSVVAIGQPYCPSVAFTSRCIWDDSHDNYAEYVYNGDNLYAVGLVYGIYCE